MTNKEKYKKAFSAIGISENFSLKINEMPNKRKMPRLSRLGAAVAACLIIITSATVSYAANIGGIQRTLQIWFNGEKTDAVIEFDGTGSYNMSFTDADGNTVNRGGGGVAYDFFGNERPLTEEELMENLNSPEVFYDKDGSVWVYWYDQKINITDKFEKDICYVKLTNGDNTLYMTVKYKSNWSLSSKKFLEP